MGRAGTHNCRSWFNEKVKDKVVAITGDASAKAGVYIEMAKLFMIQVKPVMEK